MKVDLKAVSMAIEEAIDAGRANPEAEHSNIVNEVVAHLVEQEQSRGVSVEEVKKAAHDRLHAAADQVKQMGERDDTALINAVIGTGLAILANGEDAEMFYATFTQGDHHAS